MNSRDNHENKALKTIILFASTNFVLNSLFPHAFGIGCCLVINGLMIHQLHGIGQSRRLPANVTSKSRSFFSSYLSKFNIHIETNELKNAYQNTIEGGSVVTNNIINFTKRNLT